MADFAVEVTKNALTPAVITLGNEGTVGKTVSFTFSEDWDGLTKEIIFYDLRGNVHVSPCVSGDNIEIPAEITSYGGAHKYTVYGFRLVDGYVAESLKVTGTIVTKYTAGYNPRMEGKILPSTIDLFLAQATEAFYKNLQEALDSGLFKGDPAGFDTPTASTTTLEPDEDASVTVTATGDDTKKLFHFDFAIPRGDSGVYVSETEEGQPNLQNLWLIMNPESDSDIIIPDGLRVVNGLVYMTCEGEIVGEGASVVGKNFTILGHYNTLAALRQAHPNPLIGDAYGIGTTTPYDVYLWNGSDWENYGAIGSGADIDDAMSSTSTNAVQNRVIKAYVDGLIGDVESAIAAIDAIIGE